MQRMVRMSNWSSRALIDSMLGPWLEVADLGEAWGSVRTKMKTKSRPGSLGVEVVHDISLKCLFIIWSKEKPASSLAAIIQSMLEQLKRQLNVKCGVCELCRLSKAFDAVCREALFFKLAKLGVGENVLILRLYWEYYQNSSTINIQNKRTTSFLPKVNKSISILHDY